MPNTLNGTVLTTLNFTKTGALDLEALQSVANPTFRMDLLDGAGAGQANVLWSDQRTLASNTSEMLDLAGSLVDAFGATLTFARLKYIGIFHASGNTTTLTVGNVTNGIVGPFGAATQSVTIPAGGHFSIGGPDATGWPVTAGTADLVKIANSSGASATYNIFLIGASS